MKLEKEKQTMNNLFCITYYSIKELLKSKVLINVIFIGIAITFLSFIASEFTFGVQEKIVIDLGLACLTLSNIAIAILMGAGLISDEIESKTLYMFLTRPITRSTYLAGRVLGLFSIFIINSIFIFALILIPFAYWGGKINSAILMNLPFALVEAALSLILVIFFSLIVNKTLSIIFTFSFYLAGHGINEAIISRYKDDYLLSFILENYHYVFPGFHKLNVKDYVIYNSEIPRELVISGLSYGFFYCAALLLLSCFIFEQRNLD